MAIYRERRIGIDRRKYAIYYRYGSEQRLNTERRAMESPEDGLSAVNRVISLGDIARLLSSPRQ